MPAPKKGVKRKAGGQPGHARHERPLFGADEVEAVRSYRLTACPACGGEVVGADVPPRVVQQMEWVERPIRIEEHRAVACTCARCGTIHFGQLPPEVEKGGLVGPRLTAHIAYLKGTCHASYTTIQRYLEQVGGVTLSRGQLVKVINKVTAALDPPYGELLQALPEAAHWNVDETGHKDRGQRYWTWCFRAARYTLFKIDASRGSQVLLETLGPLFAGVLGTDYFSAYRKYMRDWGIQMPFCLAHLIRDVKYLTTYPHPTTREYGQDLLATLRRLFEVIHQRTRYSRAAFEQALEQARQQVIFTATHPPHTYAAEIMAERFDLHGAAYFQFITTPGIEPTNNLAEQAIRFVVIDRRITQGTRGQPGRRWAERIWTTLATCTQQGRSVFDFLQQAVYASFTGRPAPSLLPDTS